MMIDSRNRGINFDFPPKKGTGIEKLIPHASSQCLELIYKMCTYDPDERITAKQALRHSYFRELRESEKQKNDLRKMKSHLSDAASIASTATGANSNVGNENIGSWKQNQIQKKRRRQRLLAEQQQKNIIVKSQVAVSNNDVISRAALPQLTSTGTTFGGPKSVYSTSLPKVHLPRHQFAHHPPSSTNLLPGILKTNVLQPKTLHKTKLKKEPKAIYGHSHYQLPTINRHLYHHH